MSQPPAYKNPVGEYVVHTPADIINAKRLHPDDITLELHKIRDHDPTKNNRSFVGNPLIYHFFLSVMMEVKAGVKKPTLAQTLAADSLYRKLWDRMVKLDRTGSIPVRLFEAERFNQPVVAFKTTTAKHIYHRYHATKVLDPCAGWGGRMLGAWGLGIDYIGYDTNLDLANGYAALQRACLAINAAPHLEVRYTNCLDAEFPEYDCVLTSPPYANKEIYPHSHIWLSETDYYINFLVPLLTKCLAGCKAGGVVCFNISPQMYHMLTQVHRFRLCDEEVEMLQQKRLAKDKKDKIYVWRC
jgi:hypothetical protein